MTQIVSCADEFDCMGGGCRRTRIVKDLKTRIRMGRISLLRRGYLWKAFFIPPRVRLPFVALS